MSLHMKHLACGRQTSIYGIAYNAIRESGTKPTKCLLKILGRIKLRQDCPQSNQGLCKEKSPLPYQRNVLIHLPGIVTNEMSPVIICGKFTSDSVILCPLSRLTVDKRERCHCLPETAGKNLESAEVDFTNDKSLFIDEIPRVVKAHYKLNKMQTYTWTSKSCKRVNMYTSIQASSFWTPFSSIYVKRVTCSQIL